MNRNIILFFIILFFFLTSCQNKKLNEFKEIKRIYKTISPKISKLLKKEKKILQNDVNKVWISAKQDGLPLIERDPFDSEYIFVTFLFQNSSKNKEIYFDVFGIYDEYRFGDRKLYQLNDSDLYYRSYKVPSDICFSYKFIIKDKRLGTDTKMTDIYNPDRIPRDKIHNYSYSVLDLRKNEKDWNKKTDFSNNSKLEKIKYKDNIVNKERNIYIYLPPDYNKTRKKPYPVIYLFDAFIYINRVEVPNILDNLISEGKIEPIIAVLFGTFKKTRGIILPLNFKFKRNFVLDFLPMIRKRYNICLKPENNIIGGISYGGLAASFIAFFHPEIFGKVLSQSGSFWRGLKLKDSGGNEIREDWLIKKFIKKNRKNLKFYLDWGLQENHVLGSNRRMVKVLYKKKYQFRFNEFNGWHDWSNSRKTFPKGLIYLLN